ncbi:hypothetical protein JOF29_007939 [Kribbella aluminosa]|uniref:Uncharacterized protein n=1 Tax=Kribbella aluminosa TaxID=416017 RepID=A0ABS4UZ66_9ACTN|nr:hypothetical protein [Kribbella aluminosa]MBP2356829.1 hypothetical protein [Kribbella aluminosa]
MAALDEIYVPGSSPWAADRALLASYRKQKVRVQGLQITIESTTIAARTPTTVTLRTVDHLTAGAAVDQEGTKTPLPPGQPSARLITLTAVHPSPNRPGSQPWRITTVAQA